MCGAKIADILQDVFTVSVGNIPPSATVLIKITYVTELSLVDDNISFSLPGHIAPWKAKQALAHTTQVSTGSVPYNR